MIFQYDNSKIYYNINGKGPTIVLLHGFLESASIWNKIIPQISEKYTVLVLDLPGHGRSELISEIHSMELMANVIKALLDFLKMNQVILLGHSMGGYISLAFTELFSEKVSKLILLNSTTKADSEERKINRNRAIKLLNNEKKAFIGEAIINLFSPASKKTFENEIEGLKKEASLFTKKGIIANISGMRDRLDRTSVLFNFNKEKWLLCGKEDPLIPINTSKSIAKESKTPIKILSGSHMAWLENEREIVNFLHLID